MTHEMLFIQVTILLTTFLFTSSLNLITLWYLAGIYLLLLGLILFLNDGDIFVGFLWVIDLGVGLIFFIFILHYSSFLHQKVSINKTSREISITLLLITTLSLVTYYLIYPLDNTTSSGFSKSWFFVLNWLDYYTLSSIPTITDLNLLHEVYFVNNSAEFVFINFFLFYGIIGSILLTFLVKYIFTKLSLPHFRNLNFINFLNSTFFIRNQNFLKQQFTSAGERVWVKQRFMRL